MEAGEHGLVCLEEKVGTFGESVDFKVKCKHGLIFEHAKINVGVTYRGPGASE